MTNSRAFSVALTIVALACSSSSRNSSPGNPSGGGQAPSGGAGASGGVSVAGSGGQPGTGGSPNAGAGMAGASVAGSVSHGGTVGASGGGASVSGAAGASTGVACAGKTYKLCEGFETGTEGGIPTGWTALKSYGPEGGVGLASDQFHSGKMALKSSAIDTGSGRIQKSLAALGGTATNHWGRIFYKVQTPAPIGKSSGAYYHVTFAALEGTTENRVVDTVEDPSGKVQYLFNVPDDSCCNGSAYDWKHDAAWHCAEWHADLSTQSYRFFIDGKEVTSIAFSGNANAKMSGYGSLALGTIFYVAPSGPFTAWIDDLAIDDTQIGCQ